MQAAVGAGVEDVREVRQRLVAIETGMVKVQRQEDKRGVDLLHKLSEQEVCKLHIIFDNNLDITNCAALPCCQQAMLHIEDCYILSADLPLR